MDEDTSAESLVQGLGKMRQLMGAKYALWVTLQLMAEIFCQFSASAVVCCLHLVICFRQGHSKKC